MAEWKPTENGEDPLLKCLQRPEGTQESPTLVVRKNSRKKPEKSQFFWGWLLGKRVPSVSVMGEPEIPLNIITNILSKDEAYDEMAFQDIIKSRSVHTKLANRQQADLLQSKCEKCRRLDSTNIQLINRSDIERLLGELRIESESAESESDYWNDNERFMIAHFNFADYDDSDDESDDIYKSASRGWFYPSRRSMRCIRCVDCDNRFTPNDFSMHHHHQSRYDGVYHWGLNSNNWAASLVPVVTDKMAKSSLRNSVDVWKHITQKGTSALKRTKEKDLDDKKNRNSFEISTNLIPKKKFDLISIRDDENSKIIVDDDDEDEIIDVLNTDEDVRVVAKVQQKPKNKIIPAPPPPPNLPPLQSCPTLPPNLSLPFFPPNELKLKNSFIDLKMFNPYDFKMMNKPPIDMKLMNSLNSKIIKSSNDLKLMNQPFPFDKMANLLEMMQKMKKIPTEIPKPAPLHQITAPVIFDVVKGDFQNLCLKSCSDQARAEIDYLRQGLLKIENEKRRACAANVKNAGWEAVLKEQELIRKLSDETLTILKGKPIEAPKPLPPPIIPPINLSPEIIMALFEKKNPIPPLPFPNMPLLPQIPIQVPLPNQPMFPANLIQQFQSLFPKFSTNPNNLLPK